MKTRRQILSAAAILAITGCQQSTGPTTNPTTGPSGSTAEDQAYQFAAGSLQLAVIAITAAEAIPGLVPVADVAIITSAIGTANTALTQWQAVLDQPADVQARAAFIAALADLLPWVAKYATAHAHWLTNHPKK